MPCQSDYPPGYSMQDERPAKILCAVLTVLESRGKLEKVLARVDWKEAGVSEKHARAWWGAHKAADKARRRNEKLEKERRVIADAVYVKLSPNERAAIGLNRSTERV